MGQLPDFLPVPFSFLPVSFPAVIPFLGSRNADRGHPIFLLVRPPGRVVCLFQSPPAVGTPYSSGQSVCVFPLSPFPLSLFPPPFSPLPVFGFPKQKAVFAFPRYLYFFLSPLFFSSCFRGLLFLFQYPECPDLSCPLLFCFWPRSLCHSSPIFVFFALLLFV